MQEEPQNTIHTYYRDYYPALFNYGVKFIRDDDMVKDAIQDCFYDLYLHPERLGNIKKPKNYLTGALRNLLLKQIALQKKTEEIVEMRSFEVSVEDTIIEKENKSINSGKLHVAIESLTPKQKEVLYLRFYEGLSYDDIEKITSTNYQSIRNLLSKTLKNLREAILVLGFCTLLPMENLAHFTYRYFFGNS